MEIDGIITSHPAKQNYPCLYEKLVKTHSMEMNNIHEISIPRVRLEKYFADQ